jgi:hypothetical protein
MESVNPVSPAAAYTGTGRNRTEPSGASPDGTPLASN